MPLPLALCLELRQRRLCLSRALGRLRRCRRRRPHYGQLRAHGGPLTFCFGCCLLSLRGAPARRFGLCLRLAHSPIDAVAPDRSEVRRARHLRHAKACWRAGVLRHLRQHLRRLGAKRRVEQSIAKWMRRRARDAYAATSAATTAAAAATRDEHAATTARARAAAAAHVATTGAAAFVFARSGLTLPAAVLIVAGVSAGAVLVV